MKKSLIVLVLGIMAAGIIVGCAAKEEGDTAATGTPTATTDGTATTTPTATPMAGGGGAKPGTADDMPEKPAGETAPASEGTPTEPKADDAAAGEKKEEDHTGHNHAPGEGH
jgi:hypothetical protein